MVHFGEYWFMTGPAHKLLKKKKIKKWFCLRWKGWGGGKVGLFQLAGTIFLVPSLCRIFFQDQVHCTNLFIYLLVYCFFLGGGRGWGVFYTVAVLTLTLASMWLPGTDFRQRCFSFHTVTLLYCQNYILVETNREYQTHLSGSCLTGLHCIFLFDVYGNISFINSFPLHKKIFLPFSESGF